ncbi:MAG: MOSC domain-containing protein [Spirochaetia bacterium]|nr:MOSC domain-containing protein [Spirochaetia bacterium]
MKIHSIADSAPIHGEFRIVSVNISERKGVRKKRVSAVELTEGHGIVGDAHAGPWHRQVSLLADEDIDIMRDKGVELDWGDFAENITTRGVVLHELPVGARIIIGTVELEITQIGKTCHSDCEIRKLVGDCIMPRRGIFARVVKGGRITDESSGYYHF